MVRCTGQYHEGVRAKWLAEKAGHRYRHPYDVGVFTNLVTVSSSRFSTHLVYVLPWQMASSSFDLVEL